MWRCAPILSALSLLVSLGDVPGSEGNNRPKCSAVGHFYQESTNSCLPCSSCTDNELVRRPCSLTTDTVCGPFNEFKFFQQHSDGERPAEEGKSLQHVAEKTEVHLTIYSEGSGHHMRNVAVTEAEQSQHWRTVAFALIGALSALIFLGTLVVLVTCRRINQSRTPAAQRPDDDDADCPYVVIHTIRPSESDDEVTYQVPPGPNALHQLARQRQRLYKYHPKRRLLQANEYADDVFESEDSAGSRRRISLQAIPETDPGENEGEGSPQSSTAASPLTPPAQATTGQHPPSPLGDGTAGQPPPSPMGDPLLDKAPTATPLSEGQAVPACPPSSVTGADILLPAMPTETSELLAHDTPFSVGLT